MIKKIFLYFIFGIALWFPISSFGQADYNYKILNYYTYGITVFKEGQNTDCVRDLQDKYGFTIIRKATGAVSDRQAKRWEAHNRKVDAKLLERHGEGWETRFEEDVKACTR